MAASVTVDVITSEPGTIENEANAPEIIVEDEVQAEEEARSPDELLKAARWKTAESSQKLNLAQLQWISLQSTGGNGQCLHIGSLPDSQGRRREVYMDFITNRMTVRVQLYYSDGTKVTRSAWANQKYNNFQWVWPWNFTGGWQRKQQMNFRILAKFLFCNRMPSLGWLLTPSDEKNVDECIEKILKEESAISSQSSSRSQPDSSARPYSDLYKKLNKSLQRSLARPAPDLNEIIEDIANETTVEGRKRKCEFLARESAHKGGRIVMNYTLDKMRRIDDEIGDEN